MEVSSRVKAKTFGSWKNVVVEGDEVGEEIFLVVNKLKGRVLKIEKIQHVGFGKSGSDEIENSESDDNGMTSRDINSNN